MKKPSSRIREEIAKLQEQLKAAETREAERIGRLALKAGLGEIEIEDGNLIAALEDIARKFRKGVSVVGRRPRRSRLARLRGRLIRLERRKQMETTEARKKDTRDKIALRPDRQGGAAL